MEFGVFHFLCCRSLSMSALFFGWLLEEIVGRLTKVEVMACLPEGWISNVGGFESECVAAVRQYEGSDSYGVVHEGYFIRRSGESEKDDNWICAGVMARSVGVRK